MDEFYNVYLRVCKESRLAPLECVTSLLGRGPTGNSRDDNKILDLSSFNFTPDDCGALGKALSYDHHFKKICFNDCLLSEDASKMLVYGLLNNRSLETIDLKGNNLRCAGADAVGLFLKKSTSIRCLRLDWNSLGLWGKGICALARGLAVNQTLVVLDLRNNQISHDGASELAASVKRNSTLKSLDLRWNNVGLLGGRAFLGALECNKSLTLLDLQGNNVPQDILKAIAVAINLNGERESARNEENERKERMRRRIEKIEFENTMQVSMLQEKLEEQTKANSSLSKSSHNKIKQLKEALEKKQNSFYEISKELQLKKDELTLKEEKLAKADTIVEELNNTLSLERTKCGSLAVEVQQLAENKAKVEKTIEDLTKKCANLENVLRELERENENIKIENKSRIKQMEVHNEEVIAITKEEHSSEVKSLRSSFKEKELFMKTKIDLLEKGKLDAEEKISQQKSEFVAAKLKAEEEKMDIKAQLKHDQLKTTKQYEEKLSSLQSSAEEQHAQITKYLKQIAELQKEISAKTKEASQLRDEKEAVNKLLLRNESDQKTDVSRLKMEIESERKVQEELRHKISSLESSMKDNAKKQKEIVLVKDREIENLEGRLLAKEMDLKRQREDEMRRAELLESAIFTYVSSTRASRPPSPFK